MSWLRLLRPEAPLQLYVLPYAGGSPNEFRPLQAALPPEIGLGLVILPGRDIRLREPPFRRMEPLVAALQEGLKAHLGKRYAILGHSMGSWVGYALAQSLRKAGLPLPEQLIVNARRAPGMIDPLPPLHSLSEEDFLRLMQERYGAIPAALLEDRDMLSLFLPALRADLELIESWEAPADPPLPIPITAFGGSWDPTVSPQELLGWKQMTSRSFRSHQIEGGHFFHKEPAFLETLTSTLLDEES